MTQKVERVMNFANQSILAARAVLTQAQDPAMARPARAEASLDVNGTQVRAQAIASDMDGAVDLLERLGYALSCQPILHAGRRDWQIARLKEMNIKWSLVIYGDENMLRIAAPRFRDAGVMVVWRRMLRANDHYYDWGRDIGILAEYGLPPYMQIYNEPNLAIEWDEDSDSELEDYLENFLYAAQDVYNAGGYVGIQQVREDWLAATLDALKWHGGERVFGRMFFIPHPYGLNHPPEYDEDVNAALGFLPYAAVFEQEIGFVPPMIAGEGGWKWNATDDPRYPPVDAARHRDYHMAVFDWFRTGVLSNGEPLPDTLFAFRPWLLSSKLDEKIVVELPSKCKGENWR